MTLSCEECSIPVDPAWSFCPACGENLIFRMVVSPGQRYFPTAFEGTTLRLAEYVASSPVFILTFNRFILSIQAEPTELVYFREQLTKEALRLLWNRQSNQFIPTVWAALSLCTDRYFSQKAKKFGWTDQQLQDLVAGWYELMAPAFIPGTENRRVDINVVRTWLAMYGHLQATTNLPFSDCDLCNSRCSFGYETSMVVELGEGYAADFESSLNRKNTPLAESAAWFARLAAERMIGQHNIDLAYCLVLQLLNRNPVTTSPPYNGLSPRLVRHQLEIQLAEEQALFNDVPME